MAKVNALLTERLKESKGASKMAAMARHSVNGNLTSFSGVFSVSDLSENEKSYLEDILKQYQIDPVSVDKDFDDLVLITSEVKAINNQAALLHGERIKKAQTILTRYRDGAFTAWLIATYGNRQTPYNLLQYYLFCEQMPKTLRPQIESMPKQAVYTLASRDGDIEIKRDLVEKYAGQSKAELLRLIRELFPLEQADRRRQNVANSVIHSLNRLYHELNNRKINLKKDEKQAIRGILHSMINLLD